MSADAYSTCPRCYVRKCAEWKTLRAQMSRDYGFVPMAEYDALENRADAVNKEIRRMERNEEDFGTFRRYQSFGMSPGGEFTVSFSAGCEVCGFAFDYSHKQEIEVPQDA